HIGRETRPRSGIRSRSRRVWIARGDAVIVMDADLQDPPEVVFEMVARWREGCELVLPGAGEGKADRGSSAPPPPGSIGCSVVWRMWTFRGMWAIFDGWTAKRWTLSVPCARPVALCAECFAASASDRPACGLHGPNGSRGGISDTPRRRS